MLTPWGYEMDEVPEIMTGAEFDALTGGRFSGTDCSAAIAAATQAARDYCGWHVSPMATCTAHMTGDGGRTLPLPSLAVSGIAKVVDGGHEVTDYEWSRRGFIRKATPWSTGFDSVEVTFTSGVMSASFQSVVAQIAANHLASPAGVREEHAGGVGVTYNQSNGVSGGVTLHERDMELLAPYRRLV